MLEKTQGDTMVIVKRVLSLIIVVALLIGCSTSFLTNTHPVFANDGQYDTFTTELTKQLAIIYKQKAALTPIQQKISSGILQVLQKIEVIIASKGVLNFQSLSTQLLKIDNEGNIDVSLTVLSQTDDELMQLEKLGMNISFTLPEYGVIEGSLPYNQIEAVAGLDFVQNVGIPGRPFLNAGSVTSAGDTVLRAADARSTFGIDGTGIKIGVISTGVDHLSASQASGDLPYVQVLKAGSGDEGTAMLEIIHDLAPGAELAFYTGTISSVDMVAGIAALEAAGCDIIVDDIGWSNEPKFEDGAIAQAARNFVNNGGVYVSSAGNDAQKHYYHQYVRTSGPGGAYPYAHDYGGADIGNTFTIPNGGGVVAILQWNNQWGHSGDDLDLFLCRSSDGSILASSVGVQNGNDNPWEALSWGNSSGSSVSVYIAVEEYSLVSAPSSLVLDYHAWYSSGLQYVTPENSVIGHAAVEEILSTAAAAAATPSTIESFSSHGPSTIYFPSYQNRQVPNITGVDGVQTKTGQLGYFSNPFYGTSASAPHVAAIAALVWCAQPSLTSSQVRNAITSTAVDKGTAGYDYTWGFGLADAYAAVSSVMSSPYVKLLGMDDSAVTGISGANYILIDRFQAASYGNITYIRVKCTTSGSVKVALYADNAGSPGNLLMANNTPTSVVAGWNTISISSVTVSAGTYYWIALNSSSSCLGQAAASGGAILYRAFSFSNDFPASAGTGFASAPNIHSLSAGYGTAGTVAPTVTNAAGATAITDTSATLNGNLTSTGGAATTVHIYWGLADGGTDSGSWDHDINLGTLSAGAFLSSISSLSPSTTYYYRCFATNSAGSAWAGATSSFTTGAALVKLLGMDDATAIGTGGAGYIIIDRFLAGSSGTLVQIRLKCTASGTVKVALYADNAGSPGSLLMANNTPASVVAGWNTITLTSPVSVTAGTYYWIAFNSSSSCVGYASSTGGALLYRAFSFASDFPSSAGTGFTTAANLHSLTAGWGSIVVPPPGMLEWQKSLENVSTVSMFDNGNIIVVATNSNGIYALNEDSEYGGINFGTLITVSLFLKMATKY
jgi:hypothetical protein